MSDNDGDQEMEAVTEAVQGREAWSKSTDEDIHIGPTHPSTTRRFRSQVPQIWKNFLERMDQIDQLEKQLDERVSRKRRRIQNLLDQLPSHRRSTVRMFLTHQFDKYTGIWTLVIEGKLLIGNLDHASATKVDREGVWSVRTGVPEGRELADRQSKDSQEKKKSLEEPSPNLTSKTSLIPDRHQYKIGAEEEDPVEPITFTHLFDKVEIAFRTIYQPRSATVSSYAALSTFSPLKKSRSAKRKGMVLETVPEIDPSELRASAPTKLVWDKANDEGTDAHAFWAQYNNHFSERPPPPNMKFYSIVAEITLYPTRPQDRTLQNANAEPVYQIANDLFREGLFVGKFGVRNDTKTQKDKSDEFQAESASDTTPPVPGGMNTTEYEIPLDNGIQIPLYLSYNEIVMTLFQYIQDKDLCDPADRSHIQCDKFLKDVLGVTSINFGNIKTLLLEKGIIRQVIGGTATTTHSTKAYHEMGQSRQEPASAVHLTYIMNEKSTSVQVPLGYEEEQPILDPQSSAAMLAARRVADPASSIQNDPEHSPTVLSFDMEVSIPMLFNYRVRDLLLNVKKREFEYTTCRTKARYLLVARKGNEDVIKSKIEQCISGQGFAPESIPVFLALARAAYPHSEARSAAQLDARACDLVGRIQESNQRAIAAWEAVEAMERVMGMTSSVAVDEGTTN